jgi:hypothetical protein
MNFENPQSAAEPNPKLFKVREDIQLIILSQDCDVRSDDSTELQNQKALPWIMQHAKSFAQAFKVVEDRTENFIDQYTADPQKILEQVRAEMNKIEKGETEH